MKKTRVWTLCSPSPLPSPLRCCCAVCGLQLCSLFYCSRLFAFALASLSYIAAPLLALTRRLSTRRHSSTRSQRRRRRCSTHSRSLQPLRSAPMQNMFSAQQASRQHAQHTPQQQATPALMPVARSQQLQQLSLLTDAAAASAPPSSPPSRDMLDFALLEPYLQRAEADSAPAVRIRSAAAAADAGAFDSESDDVDSIENADSPQQHRSSAKSAAAPLFRAQSGRSYAFSPQLDLKAEAEQTRTHTAEQKQNEWHDGLPLAPKIVMKDVALVRVRQTETRAQSRREAADSAQTTNAIRSRSPLLLLLCFWPSDRVDRVDQHDSSTRQVRERQDKQTRAAVNESPRSLCSPLVACAHALLLSVAARSSTGSSAATSRARDLRMDVSACRERHLTQRCVQCSCVPRRIF